MAGSSPRRWMRSVTRPLWGHFREVLVISLFVNLLALAAPVFTLQVYDRVVFYSGLTTLQGLAIGMVVTIEPGVYLPEWGGVRLEDDFLVTRDGCVRLTTLPHDPGAIE